MAVQRKFRTGAGFKHSRNDGRQVWVSGERITDISSHPATRGVVDALAEWYDYTMIQPGPIHCSTLRESPLA